MKAQFQVDTFQTSEGPLLIHFIGHGTLMMEFNNQVIHIDPFREANYDKLPKANLVLITHHHGDHLDKNALNKVVTDHTKIICTELCYSDIASWNPMVMKNGDETKAIGLKIKAVPAYNIKNKRPDGSPFHGPGEGNGYIVSFGNVNVYIAGDTENTPEMKALQRIDIAFLPMNLPYTMTPEMVTDAAKSFKPKVLYPYHYGQTDTNKLLELMKDQKDTEVRIRKM